MTLNLGQMYRGCRSALQRMQLPIDSELAVKVVTGVNGFLVGGFLLEEDNDVSDA